MALRLGRHRFPDEARLVMAVVNRTPDSFYDAGATWSSAAAYERVAEVVEQGADIVDIGGVKAGSGAPVGVAEELDRVVSFVAGVRERHPQVVLSVDTWRAEVAREVCAAGADLLNDAWGGVDPELAEVAAANDVALVCSHSGGIAPRSEPGVHHYDDVMLAVVDACTALAERAVSIGVAPESVVVDPAHDFAKTTAHSLEVTRRLGELVATGWPVLVALSRKDFVGETLDRPPGERLAGTLAATTVAALAGARIFRTHDVPETRDAVDMALSIAGWRPPARPERGLGPAPTDRSVDAVHGGSTG